MSADGFRLLTIFVTLLAGLLFPWAIYLRTKTKEALLVVVVLTINFLGASLAVADSIGHPIVWYRTPRIFVASVLALVYVAVVARHPRPPNGR